MRRGLVTLVVFVAVVVAGMLLRRDGPALEVSAAPAGAWDAASCEAVPDGFGLGAARELCLESDGSAAFELTVTNATDDTLAVTTCTVEPFHEDGSPASTGSVVVPIRFTYGVPYTAAYLEPGGSISLHWFVRGSAPDDTLVYEASCDWTTSSGPVPL